MAETGSGSVQALAEVIAHLGRLASGDGSAGGMTQAQWAALRYFARANRFSRTVSGFAEFHATTRGTASQTVKGLVGQGYLSRTRSDRDGRSALLQVTEKGRAALAGDPFEVLMRAAAKLPERTRASLAGVLGRLLQSVAGERHRRPFGICRRCAHLQRQPAAVGRGSGYACALVGEGLASGETEQICQNYQPPPGRGGSPRHDWQPPA